MKAIEEYINKKKRKFSKHIFFDNFSKHSDIQLISQSGIGLVFWVMTFQDLVRINVERFENRDLKEIAMKHRMEDQGHDLWLLSDLKKMGVRIPTLQEIYQEKLIFSRDASYLLLNVALNTKSDLERLVLIESLESVSEIFFGYTSKYIDSISPDTTLHYFSKIHFNVELAHDNEAIDKLFNTQVLSDRERNEIVSLIDRVYDAFELLIFGIDNMIKNTEGIVKDIGLVN